VNRDDKFVLILAENYQQGARIAQDQGLTKRGRWAFLFDAAQVRGRRSDTTRVVAGGTFWRRRDAQEVVDELRAHGMPPEAWAQVTS
jgi:hypothetical protein